MGLDLKKVAIVIVLFFIYLMSYNMDVFTGGTKAGGVNANGKKQEPIPVIDPASLVKPTYDYPGVTRDIFSPVKPPPPRVDCATEPRHRKCPANCAKDPKDPRCPPKCPGDPRCAAPPPKAVDVFMKGLDFMGFMEQAAELTVYIAASDGEVYIVRKGDIIGSKYDVVGLTDKLMTIKDRHTGDTASLSLSE